MTTAVKFKGFLSWLWKQLVAILLIVYNFLITIARYLSFQVENGGEKRGNIIDDDSNVDDEEVAPVSDSTMDDTDNFTLVKKSLSATNRKNKRKMPRITPDDKNMNDSVGMKEFFFPFCSMTSKIASLSLARVTYFIIFKLRFTHCD